MVIYANTKCPALWNFQEYSLAFKFNGNKAKDYHFRKLLNRLQYPDIGSRSFYKMINTVIL